MQSQSTKEPTSIRVVEDVLYKIMKRAKTWELITRLQLGEVMTNKQRDLEAFIGFLYACEKDSGMLQETLDMLRDGVQKNDELNQKERAVLYDLGEHVREFMPMPTPAFKALFDGLQAHDERLSDTAIISFYGALVASPDLLPIKQDFAK